MFAMKNRLFIRLAGALFVLFLFCTWGCGEPSPYQGMSLKIAAGSESKEIEPLIRQFAEKHKCDIHIEYKGSVDMMLDLASPGCPYDAVLPANSMWIRLGDKSLHRTSDEASIMRSPVVLGVKKSLAQRLGWIGEDVAVADILAAVRAGDLHFAMTSATQSNSGASAYMGLLYAFAGRPQVLESSHLMDPSLNKDIRDILGGIERSSGSSGWLKDLYIKKADSLDAMYNYEAMVIAANQELTRQGKEPLYVIYPVDGLAIADSTLAFVNKQGNGDKKPLFLALRDYLLSPEVQKEIFRTGFRTGLIGMNPEDVDKKVYNPNWGVDLNRTISPITWPRPDVIQQALTLYQTEFRKPSFTVYLLDVSGSMRGEGLPQLKKAMTGLLDPQSAEKFMLQTGRNDATVVVAFSDGPRPVAHMEGNAPNELRRVMGEIHALNANGGTNIYAAVQQALVIMKQNSERMEGSLPSIILMTDGKSNKGSLDELMQQWRGLNAPFALPPVFGVTFGEADDAQLKELAELTSARVFDGRKHGLMHAFRSAKGYN